MFKFYAFAVSSQEDIRLNPVSVVSINYYPTKFYTLRYNSITFISHLEPLRWKFRCFRPFL